MDPVDSSLFREFKITFQTGKGIHLVPVLIPLDVVTAMQCLADAEIRSCSSVHPNNRYMFPATQLSPNHVYGWAAVNKVCIDAKLEHPERMNATHMRHRISTLYAGLDVPESDRQYFYKHMGHSANVNQNIYQTPLAEVEILKVGSQLRLMDGQTSSLTSRQQSTFAQPSNCQTPGPSTSDTSLTSRQQSSSFLTDGTPAGHSTSGSTTTILRSSGRMTSNLFVSYCLPMFKAVFKCNQINNLSH